MKQRERMRVSLLDLLDARKGFSRHLFCFLVALASIISPKPGLGSENPDPNEFLAALDKWKELKNPLVCKNERLFWFNWSGSQVYPCPVLVRDLVLGNTIFSGSEYSARRLIAIRFLGQEQLPKEMFAKTLLSREQALYYKQAVETWDRLFGVLDVKAIESAPDEQARALETAQTVWEITRNIIPQEIYQSLKLPRLPDVPGTEMRPSANFTPVYKQFYCLMLQDEIFNKYYQNLDLKDVKSGFQEFYQELDNALLLPENYESAVTFAEQLKKVKMQGSSRPANEPGVGFYLSVFDASVSRNIRDYYRKLYDSGKLKHGSILEFFYGDWLE